MAEWHGDNPYCLIVMVAGVEPNLIDLDEPQWATSHASLMRTDGRWILARKSDSMPVLTLLVSNGDQPYYTSKVHTSFLPPPEFFTQNEITIDPKDIKELSQVRSYGIGKKRVDGVTERLWILPNGVICGGDDVEVFGADLARSSLADVIRRLQDGSDNERQGGNQEGGSGRQEAGSSGSRNSGPGVHQLQRSEAAHGTAEQRAASRAMARARLDARRKEAQRLEDRNSRRARVAERQLRIHHEGGGAPGELGPDMALD